MALERKDAHDLSMKIVDLEKANPNTTYDGHGREWVGWIIYRLYEHGFAVCVAEEKEKK